MALNAGEQQSGGLVFDADGRQSVSIQGGAGAGGGGGGGLTDVQLRASPVPVSLSTGIDVIDRAARLLGHVTIDNASLAVTGPLTDGQLRASAVPVSGAFFQATQPVSGSFFQATQPVSLAAAVDVSDRNARRIGQAQVLDTAAAAIDPALKGQLPAALVGGRLDINVGAITGTSVPINNVETIVDNAAYVDGTSRVFPQGYIFDEVAGTALTENDIAAPRIDAKRAPIGVIEDATTRGQRAAVSAAGRLSVDASGVALPLAAGANVIGQVGLDARTTGGVTPNKTISAATTNSKNIKASAGMIYFIHTSNINAAVRYLKLYDKATAPTVGTDVPVWTLAIPGNAAGAGFVMPIPVGLVFTTGIGIGITTGSADADVGAVAASDIIVNIGFK